MHGIAMHTDPDLLNHRHDRVVTVTPCQLVLVIIITASFYYSIFFLILTSRIDGSVRGPSTATGGDEYDRAIGLWCLSSFSLVVDGLVDIEKPSMCPSSASHQTVGLRTPRGQGQGILIIWKILYGYRGGGATPRWYIKRKKRQGWGVSCVSSLQ